MQKHRKQVREIPANPFLQNQNRGKRLRVAAYCRVSTEQEEQESSFENQVEYYTNLIQSNPEWECAGIFADRGISGTKDTIRPEFKAWKCQYSQKNRLPAEKAAGTVWQFPALKC